MCFVKGSVLGMLFVVCCCCVVGYFCWCCGVCGYSVVIGLGSDWCGVGGLFRGGEGSGE